MSIIEKAASRIDQQRQNAAATPAAVIVADLTPDEGGPFETVAAEAGLAVIYLVAPTSSPGRRAAVAGRSGGFLYCVSRLGVTGDARTGEAPLKDYIDRVRARTSLPLALGFGVNGPEKARLAACVADGVVVGSALVSLLHPCGADRTRLVAAASGFVRSLREAVDGACAI